MSTQIDINKEEEKKRLEEYFNLLMSNYNTVLAQAESMWRKKTTDSQQKSRTEQQFSDLTNTHVTFLTVLKSNLEKLGGQDVNLNIIRKETEKGMADYLKSLEKISKTPNLPTEDRQSFKNAQVAIGQTIIAVERLEAQRPKASQKPDHWFISGLKKVRAFLAKVAVVPALVTAYKEKQKKLISSTLGSAKHAAEASNREAQAKIEHKSNMENIKAMRSDPDSKEKKKISKDYMSKYLIIPLRIL